MNNERIARKMNNQKIANELLKVAESLTSVSVRDIEQCSSNELGQQLSRRSFKLTETSPKRKNKGNLHFYLEKYIGKPIRRVISDLEAALNEGYLVQVYDAVGVGMMMGSGLHDSRRWNRAGKWYSSAAAALGPLLRTDRFKKNMLSFDQSTQTEKEMNIERIVERIAATTGGGEEATKRSLRDVIKDIERSTKDASDALDKWSSNPAKYAPQLGNIGDALQQAKGAAMRGQRLLT